MSTSSEALTLYGPRPGLRLLIMGPPGAGKGTQSAVIGETYGIPAISTGDIFRSNVAAGTPLGVRVQQIMASGGYIDDDITNAVVGNRLAEQDTQSGFLLDGYPRTVPQVESLDHLLTAQSAELTAVILLVVGTQDVTTRLLSRAEQQGRADDTAEAIRTRQQVYEHETAPVLDLYRRRRCLLEVDALGARDEVTHRILTAMGTTRAAQL